MSELNINRAQLAKFLPSPQAIKAFEDLFRAVSGSLPSDTEGVEFSAGVAQQQAAEALSSLAVVANQLALLLLAPPIGAETEDQFSQTVAFGNRVDFSNRIDMYIPPQQPVASGLLDPNNVKITGGTIDGTVIGGTVPAAGYFSNLYSTNQLIVGYTSTPVTGANVTVQGTAAGFAAVRYNAAAGLMPYTNHYRSRGSTVGTPAAVASGDGTGRYTTYGYNATSAGYVPATEVRGEVDGTPGPSDMPGRLIFATTTSGATSASEKMRLTNDGNLQLGKSTATAGAEKLQVNGSLSINSATMLRTYTAFANGAAAAIGTLTNAPAAGNPTKWIPINDNGTTRYIPAW